MFLDPRCLRVLADTYQRRLDFRMPVHRAPEVFRRDVVLPKVRVCERDDKVVVTVECRHLVYGFLDCCHSRVTTRGILCGVLHLFCDGPALRDLVYGVTDFDKGYLWLVS